MYPTTKHVDTIHTMAAVLAGTRDWPFKVADLDEANTLLEVAVGLLVTAHGTFDADDDRQMLDAARTSLALIEHARRAEGNLDELGALLPTSVRESHAVIVTMARLAAQAFEAAGQAEENLLNLHSSITATELSLTKTAEGNAND